MRGSRKLARRRGLRNMPRIPGPHKAATAREWTRRPPGAYVERPPVPPRTRATMRTRLLLALLAVLAAASAAPAQEVPSIRPGDAVRLVVWRLPEFTGEYAVAPDGTLLHPLLTEVRVVGRTREEVHQQLRRVLLRYENDPQLVFDYLYRVSVTGEVRLPGLYTLPPETTLAQAIAAGGGAAEFGRLDRVRLLRGGTETVLDLRNPSPEVAEMRIRSGDQLRLDRRGAGFRDYLGLAASLVAAVGAVVAAIAATTR
jgi:protein involved in polysaccharide export with SLBB domain